MIMDSERFAFIPRRIHAFATSGNAYDACQTDEAIKTGHTLLILSEGVVHSPVHGPSRSPPQAVYCIRSSARTTTRSMASLRISN